MDPKRDSDASFLVVSRRGDPVVDLIVTGCLTCGASVHEVKHQQGDLCPMCERRPKDA